MLQPFWFPLIGANTQTARTFPPQWLAAATRWPSHLWVSPHLPNTSHPGLLQSIRESSLSPGVWMQSPRCVCVCVYVRVSPAMSSWYLSTSHTSSGSFPTSKVMFHISRVSLRCRWLICPGRLYQGLTQLSGSCGYLNPSTTFRLGLYGGGYYIECD